MEVKISLREARQIYPIGVEAISNKINSPPGRVEWRIYWIHWAGPSVYKEDLKNIRDKSLSFLQRISVFLVGKLGHKRRSKEIVGCKININRVLLNDNDDLEKYKVDQWLRLGNKDIQRIPRWIRRLNIYFCAKQIPYNRKRRQALRKALIWARKHESEAAEWVF